MTVDLRGAAYAASRISSTLKGSTKQFGWLQASATKVASLSNTSANPATIRICISQRRFETVAFKDSSSDLSVLDVSLLLAP
jgi:hypothetical protein